jgi:rubrerythrin
LVEAAIQRQDDLRAAMAELRRSEMDHLEAMAELRAQHADDLRKAESARIDAIRAVDVGAAAILANQVAASAEALRGQVEAARQQTATALDAALQPIKNDISDLRKTQYEQAGQKSAVVEQKSSTTDLRTLWLAAVGVLILAATFIAPHIH